MNPLILPLVSATVLGGVVLRGDSGAVEGEVTQITAAGIRVDEQRVIGWDRVRTVTGERSADALQFTELADKSWRARIRLARGDLALAHPLYEELFDRFVRNAALDSGPTGLSISEGLLTCLTAEGQSASAVEPWLIAASLRETAPGTPSAGGLDDATLLCPVLPPMFLASPALESMLDAPTPAALASGAAAGGAAARLAEWTLAAARFESSATDAVLPKSDAENHPGVLLVARMTTARIGSPEQRDAARASLRADLAADAGSWREAWRRAAIGRSMLMEPDRAVRRAGVVELLHVPARFSSSQPTLAALCLAEAVAELRRSGDPDAEALLSDLARVDRTGSARRWLVSGAAASPSARAFDRTAGKRGGGG